MGNQIIMNLFKSGDLSKGGLAVASPISPPPPIFNNPLAPFLFSPIINPTSQTETPYPLPFTFYHPPPQVEPFANRHHIIIKMLLILLALVSGIGMGQVPVTWLAHGSIAAGTFPAHSRLGQPYHLMDSQ